MIRNIFSILVAFLFSYHFCTGQDCSSSSSVNRVVLMIRLPDKNPDFNSLMVTFKGKVVHPLLDPSGRYYFFELKPQLVVASDIIQPEYPNYIIDHERNLNLNFEQIDGKCCAVFDCFYKIPKTYYTLKLSSDAPYSFKINNGINISSPGEVSKLAENDVITIRTNVIKDYEYYNEYNLKDNIKYLGTTLIESSEQIKKRIADNPQTGLYNDNSRSAFSKLKLNLKQINYTLILCDSCQ